MSWDEQVVKRNAKPVICMELLLDNETLYFSDVGSDADDVDWKSDILGMGSITRAVDPIAKQASVSDVSVSLRNYLNEDNVSWWQALDDTTEINGRVVNIYVKFKEADDSWSSKKVYSGLASPGLKMGKTIELNIKPRLQTELAILQRQVNTTDHPNAPEQSVGFALAFVLGNSDGVSGSVRGIMVDDDSGGTDPEIAFASHECHAIEEIFRERDGTLSTTPLTPTTHYTENLFEFDASGNAYCSITLKVAAGHQEGDKYYGHIHGLCDDRHYITLNGSSQYCYHANDAAFNLNDTISVLSRFRAHSLSGLQVIEGKTAATTGARLALFDDEVRWYIGGESNYIETVGANLQTDTWYLVVGTFDSNGSIQEIFVVVAQTLVAVTGLQTTTRTGPVPTEIGLNTSQLRIGADRTGGNKFDGDIDLVILTTAVTLTGDEISPFGTQAYWHFAGNLNDNSSFGNTLSSSGSPTFTPCLLLENPICALEGMFTNRSGWGLSFTELDSALWDAARDEALDRGYQVSGSFGGPIGDRATELQGAANPWTFAQLVAANADFQLYTTLDGLIGIKTIDISTLSTASDLVVYDQHKGDFTEDVNLVRNPDPWKKINSVRGILKFGQSANQFESFLRATNQLSIDKIKLSKDSNWKYQFVRAKAMLKDVIARQLTLRSGKTEKVSWTVPGLWGLQSGSDIGDVVKLKTDGLHGSSYVQAKQVIVTSVSANYLARTVTLSGLTVGDTVGTIAFDSQETDSVNPIIDTFVSEGDPTNSFGSNTTLLYGDDFSGIPGTDNRIAMRFSLAQASGSTNIVSATLTVKSRSFTDPAQLVLRELNSTAWSGSSTWNNFDGSAWSDALILSTDLSDTILPSFSLTERIFTFNASGLAFLTAAIGNDIQLTVLEIIASAPFNWGINSMENSDTPPLLTFVHE